MVVSQEIIQIVKKNFFVKKKSGETLVYGYVLDKKNKKNIFTSINCQSFISLQPVIYDNATNSISVYCCEFFFLGKIKFTIKGKFRNCLLSEFYIPIPNNIIYKNLNKRFQNTYKGMKKKYKNKKDYVIKLLQLVEP